MIVSAVPESGSVGGGDCEQLLAINGSSQQKHALLGHPIPPDMVLERGRDNKALQGQHGWGRGIPPPDIAREEGGSRSPGQTAMGDTDLNAVGERQSRVNRKFSALSQAWYLGKSAAAWVGRGQKAQGPDLPLQGKAAGLPPLQSRSCGVTGAHMSTKTMKHQPRPPTSSMVTWMA